MLRIVIVTAVLALVLGGCSNKDQEVTSTPTSPAPKTDDSVKGTTSDAGNVVQQAQDAAPGTRETAREKDATGKPVRKEKEGTKQSKEAPSVVGDNWRNFLATVKKCDALTGAQNTQCMTDAAATYRAWNFNCEAMAPQDRLQCRSYSERWNTANADSPRPAVRTGDPNAIPADPGDPSDKLRNRDSTKQQAAVPQAPKQN